MLVNDFIYFLILSPCIRNLQAFNNRKIVNFIYDFAVFISRIMTKHSYMLFF
jgi:hypothetical protein